MSKKISNIRTLLNEIYSFTLNRTKKRLEYLRDLNTTEEHIDDLASKEALDNVNIKLSFIISTGRTGTKFLATLFDRIPQVVALHEPKPDFLFLGFDIARHKVPFDLAKAFFIKHRTPMLEKFSETYEIYIESNNRLFSLVPIICDAFRDRRFELKIVHLVRDGRDVVRSGFSRGWYSSFDPFPRLQATDFSDDPWYDSWRKFDRFEKISWLWQKKDYIIYNDIESVRGMCNVLRIKFEDIFNPNTEYEGLWRLIDFLGISDLVNESSVDVNKLMSSPINKNPSYTLPHWKQWNTKQREQFSKIAGDHMQRLGYSLDGWYGRK